MSLEVLFDSCGDDSKDDSDISSRSQSATNLTLSGLTARLDLSMGSAKDAQREENHLDKMKFPTARLPVKCKCNVQGYPPTWTSSQWILLEEKVGQSVRPYGGR